MGQQKRGRWKGQFTKTETSEAAPGTAPPPPPAPAEPQGPDLLSPRDLQAVDSASLLETGPCWERRVGSLQDSGIQT